MKNLLRLSFILFKGSGLVTLGSESSRRKKRSQAGSIILFVFVALYMAGMMAASSLALFELLSPAGLQSMVIGLYLSAGTVFVFFFGVLYVISIFYYSNDVARLLPLPLKAVEIIGAKLIVTAAWMYIYLAMLILPPLVVYGICSQFSIGFFLFLGTTLLLLPVVPLCLASVLVLVLLRFTPLARNKDRFNLITGLLAMAIALLFVSGSQSMASFSEADLARLISSGAGAAARLVAVVFPGTGLAVQILAAESLADQLLPTGLLLLLSAAALAVTMGAAQVLYFPGVVGITGSAGKRGPLSAAQLRAAGHGGSAFWSCWLKDLRILMRTPIFFMNNVLMNFLWPVFFLVPFLSGTAHEGTAELLASGRQILFDRSGQGPAIATAAYFVLACFIASVNGIAASALSREGSVFYIMKIVPLSWWKQIMAKIGVAVFFSLCGALLPLLLLIPLLRPPVWFVLLLLSVLPGAVLVPNAGGVFFELLWPKLNWDNEQKAVKQNLNVLYGLFLALLAAAALSLPTLVFSLPLVPSWLLQGPGSLLLALFLLRLLHLILPGRMQAIEP